MKNHRKTGALRLLALVLFLVVVAPGAFAAGINIDTSFPFLSVDTNQLTSIWGAFTMQWYLFSSFNNGAVPALYYVALAAAMVGAISIVFNAKSQDFKTIAAWLLVTIVCLFAPFNSKLLFYEVKKPVRSGAAAEIKSPDGKDITTKGFTPQLVAAHIGTTLQVIFTDMFNSVQMTSLVDSVLGKIAVSSSPVINPGGSWLGGADQYHEECPSYGILPKDLLEKSVAPNSEGQSGLTMADALRQIDSSYRAPSGGGVKADFRVPPPAIELYKTMPSTWTIQQQSAYKLGLEYLYNNLKINGNKTQYEVVESSPGPNQITIDAAVSEINTAAKTLVTKTQTDPGSLLYYIQMAGDGVGGNASQLRDRMAQCGSVVVRGGTTDQCNNLMTAYSKGLESVQGTDCGGPAECSKLGYFKEIPQELANMPVSMFVYTGSGSPADVTWSTPGKGVEGTSISSRCDLARGDALYQSVFKESGLAGWFDNLKKMVDGKATIPHPSQWKLETIYDNGLGVVDATLGSEQKQFAQELVNIAKLPNNWKGVDWFGPDTEQNQLNKRKYLANLVVESAKSSAAVNSKSAASKASAGVFDMKPTQTGSWAANTIGTVAAYAGEKLVTLLSIFAGYTAVAVIYFLRVMIDIALMGVIVLTPIAFLMAIAIPTHAFGVLVQSFMIIGVLKLVPVTFVIVDRLGSFIYGTIQAVGGEQQSLKEGLFLFAIAGIYTGLVGMTMFLLFKIGDPQNISKLGELDKAAEKAADAGMKLAQALGTAAAGLLIVRPALGAISGLGAAKDAKRGSDAEMEAERKEGDRLSYANKIPEELMDSNKGLAEEGFGIVELEKRADALGLSGADKQAWIDKEWALESDYQKAKAAGGVGWLQSKESWMQDRHDTLVAESAAKAAAEEAAYAGAEAEAIKSFDKHIGSKLGRSYDKDNALDYTMVKRLAEKNLEVGGNGLADTQEKMFLEGLEAQAVGGIGVSGGATIQGGSLQLENPKVDKIAHDAEAAVASRYSAQANASRKNDELEGIRRHSGKPTVWGTGQGKDLYGANAEGIAKSIENQKRINREAGRAEYDGIRNWLDGVENKMEMEYKARVNALPKGASGDMKQRLLDEYKENTSRLRSAIGTDEYRNISQMKHDTAGGWLGSRLIDGTNAKMRMQYMKEGMIGSFKSGWSETAGALAKIPIIGDIVAPHMDEIIHGGQRARAKIGSGKSWKEYMDNQKKAKYDEYFSKEMGMQQKGMQYEQNLLSGTNYAQGQMVLARKAAAEAAAKVADEVRAALAVRPSGEFSVGDFRGAQLISALDSLNQTLKHAAFIQKGEVGLAGGGKVQLNEAVLQRLSTGAGDWKSAKPVEALFEGHLKGIEKDIRYKNAKGVDITARVNMSPMGKDGKLDMRELEKAKSAMAKAAMMDMDTDYAELFEIGLVEKKDQFMMQAELAKAYRGILGYEKEVEKRLGKPRITPDMSLDDQLAAKSAYPRGRMSAMAQVEGWNRGVLRSAGATSDQIDPLELQLQQKGRTKYYAKRFQANETMIANSINQMLQQAGMSSLASRRVVEDLEKFTMGSPRLQAAFANSANRTQFLDAILQLIEQSGEAGDKSVMENLERIVRGR